MTNRTIPVLLILVSLFYTVAKGQEEKHTVGIMQFSSADDSYKSRAAEIQQIVVEVFASKKHIVPLDRSTDEILNKELLVQKQGNVMNSAILVEQGKKLGAQDMVTGTVSSVDAEMKKSGGGYNAFTKSYNPETTSYNGKASFSIQIVDVETGTVKASKSFELKNSSTTILGIRLQTYNTREDAMSNVVKANKKLIVGMIDGWVNEQYPPQLKIFDVVTRDKKGFPETVRIIGGSDAGIKEGVEIIMQNYAVIVSEGRNLVNSKDIGMLKVKELNGDFTVCKVTKGEDLLEKAMTDKSLRLIIKAKNK